MKPVYVGILVGNGLYQGIPTGRTRHEKCSYYEQAGLRFGLRPCYFRLKDIVPLRSTVLAYVKVGNRYVKRRVPMPTVIHNRCLYRKPSSKRKLAELAGRIAIFNGGNRYGKREVHEWLMANHAIRPHLPGTLPYSEWALRRWMSCYNDIIIKPDNGSIGNGVCKLTQTDHGWVLRIPAGRYAGTYTERSKKHGGMMAVLQKMTARSNYIVQQRLPLATLDGRPFDFRVSVQKNETGEWQLTGIVGKVAAPGKFITNVAKGGEVYRYEKLLEHFPHLHPEHIEAAIGRLSMMIAEQLEMTMPHAADFGMDIGMTAQGFPVFIECNCRDLRYSFGKAGMPEVWKASYSHPIGYAWYLLRRQNSVY